MWTFVSVEKSSAYTRIVQWLISIALFLRPTEREAKAVASTHIEGVQVRLRTSGPRSFCDGGYARTLCTDTDNNKKRYLMSMFQLYMIYKYI